MKTAAILISVISFGSFGSFGVFGCGVDDVEGTEPEAEVTDTAKIAMNGMFPSDLSTLNISSAKLTAASAAAQASTVIGRRVLTNIVNCALPAGESLTVTVSGVNYTFAGAMGLGPMWKMFPLTVPEKQSVSGCVYARINMNGISLNISLRGAHGGFSMATGEASTYYLEEGGFWGNIFNNSGPVKGYACNGVDQLANDTTGQLPNRECAEDIGGTTPCGFEYAGPCVKVCTWNAAGYYTDCTSTDLTTFAAPATIYVN
ncbi:MAG: hypothetical protein H0T79_21255 [Deltaproteobacteria bacterium]|nr:hypothetical protein [Deltaproteobacteria bacterium]